ncbi:MAG: imidazolonepropionase [Planctomycetota bacterium]
MRTVDLILERAAELVTLAGGPRAGRRLDDLALIPDGAIAVEHGRIVAVGTSAEIATSYSSAHVIDACGRCVLPGFVDCHTHPVFGATREAEFDQRIRGLTYEEITARGGGIFSSVRSLRATPTEELRRAVRRRFDEFIRLGTTTIEAKSGYGLEGSHELRSLEVLRDVAATHPLEVSATFLGAHQCPPEHQADRDGYIRLLTEKLMPQIRQQGLAESCDVFCEKGVFSLAESRRILQRARELGFRLRLHADQLHPLGGAELASELGAASADHLEHATAAALKGMREAGVVAVLLPGSVYSLGLRAVPDARAMIAEGLTVALATDFNPGTSFIQSMPMVISIACAILKLTVAEAVAAATINAAHSLGRGEQLGSLEPGKQADFIVLDRPSHLFLGYQVGADPVEIVVKRGKIVCRKSKAAVAR